VARSLDELRKFRLAAVRFRKWLLKRRFGILLDDSVNISMTSRFVARTRGAITVGSETYVAFKTLVIAHDTLADVDRPIHIGRRCFIGGGSMICPGVTIGDESIVAAGSVVTSDVPPASIVGGNPAVLLKNGIRVGPYGRLEGSDERSRSLPR